MAYTDSTQGCTIPDIARCQAIWQSREALRKYILGKVSEAYDVLAARHFKTYQYYIHVATRETRVSPEVISQALGTAIFARDLLFEGAMARRYFTYVFYDLRKSEEVADIHTLNVPSATATILGMDHQECNTKQRTYQSGGSHFVICGTASDIL